MAKHFITVHRGLEAPLIKVSTIKDAEVIEIKDDIKSNKPNTKSNSKNTKCDKCDFRSISLRSLDLHKKRSHTPLLNCDQCEKTFAKLTILEQQST